MKYKITAPLTLKASIKLPSSKSISNRALVISAMAGADMRSATLPDNLSDCDDTDVIVSALRNMPSEINIKAAGTAMRFMTAFLSVCEGEEHVLTGTERMQHRPIRVLVDALRQLGADIEYVGEEGFPPLRIRGKQLTVSEVSIKGDVSSQYISALLMIGPKLANGLRLKLEGNIVSRPYIDLTLATMRDFGAKAAWAGVDTIVVEPHPYTPTPYFIESDWSASSYWYELMALYCDSVASVTMDGLMKGSRQGDSAVQFMFEMLGVKTTFGTDQELTPTTVQLSYDEHNTTCMYFDFTHQPDLAQTLIATCLACGIKFHFRGLASLKIKETDRIEAMKTEVRRLGYVIYDYNDCELRWDGERCEPEANAEIQTYDDHRMAMALAPMSVITGTMVINNPEVVSKSYPHYWDDLRKIGFNIEEITC